MALINNIYVLAEKEDLDNDVETKTHPVESSEIPTASGIKKQPISLNISGKIVDNDNLTAQQTIAKLKKLQKDGSLIKYIGQCGTLNNLQIQSFKDSYSHKNYGGADFTMTLVEIRITKSAYVAPTKVTVTSKQMKVGDTVRFAGGYVYVSSDARYFAARRGSSTCKLTKISSLPNAKHIYHLISKDCKFGSGNYVYGWVDADKVSAISTTTIPSATNGGTQQIKEAKQRNVIYHTVKKGETIWGLVNRTYKGKGFTVNKVIQDNPNAFSKPNKATTLKIGARLKLQK